MSIGYGKLASHVSKNRIRIMNMKVHSSAEKVSVYAQSQVERLLTSPNESVYRFGELLLFCFILF